MALTSAGARPNEAQVTQTKRPSERKHVPVPAGRIRLRNEDRGEDVIAKGKALHRTGSERSECGTASEGQGPRNEHIHAQKEVRGRTPSDSRCGSLAPSLSSDAVSDCAREGAFEPRPFRAFGIDAYPSLALKKEICIDFIDRERWCPYSTQCHRIHPREKLYYLSLLKQGRSQRLFHQDDSPFSPADAAREEANRATLLGRVSVDPPSTKPPSPSPADSLPSRDPEYGWNPATGDWSFNLDQEAWNSEDSSSSGGSVHLPATRRASHGSRNSSDTEEDTSTSFLSSHSLHRRELCRDFLKGSCAFGSSCRFYHDVERKQEGIALQVQALRPAPTCSDVSSRPRSGERMVEAGPSGICNLWLKGKCWRGKTCRFYHTDAQTTSCLPSPSTKLSSSMPARRHQRPPFDETCRQWLRGECQKGPLCSHVHDDLEYDETAPRRALIQVPPRTDPERFSTVIYKHMRIQVTEGFEIAEVVTGFETSWIYVGNVPRRVQQQQLTKFLKSHGELVDLRIPETSSGPFVVVKARFSTAAEASKVCSVLDGLEAFGSTLTAKLSISINNDARTHFNDTTVRIQWEAPAKTAYVGFASKESSEQAMRKCRSVPLDKHLLKVAIHTGIPAVGRFNLRLEAVPVDVDTDRLKEFLDADAVMWGQTNYTSEVRALNGIQKMMKECEVDILEFHVMPPPFKGGMVCAWAHLGTSVEAKKLADYMHVRKPRFTGLTRIFARHVQSLEYNLTKETYENVRRDIDSLGTSVWNTGQGILSVACRVLPTSVLVRMTAEDTQGLSKLKDELDIILSGEVVREDGKVVWDRYFSQIAGQAFTAGLERQHAPLTIKADKIRKHIRLFGASHARQAAKTKIMEKLEELRKQSVNTFPLDGQMLGAFMNDGLSRLTKELGDDCVQLDLWNRTLVSRGDQHVHNAVRDMLSRTRRGLITNRLPALIECPVCFDEVTTPITLCCGHSWCKTCIIRYMLTAVDQKVFPLTCLGNDARCEEKIPLSCAKQLLPPSDFEALIEASFSSHVHRRLHEFAYCPTPDCQQIYRRPPRVVAPPTRPQKSANSPSSPSGKPPASASTVLQCPSCLVRICATCQTEAHDGLACTRPEESDDLFEEWMRNNDVKPCPGCKMPIEKVMGCHHVTCAVCSIHLCWVCLTPFHNGAGVYSHMLAVHGSFV